MKPTSPGSTIITDLYAWLRNEMNDDDFQYGKRGLILTKYRGKVCMIEQIMTTTCKVENGDENK